MLAIHAGRPSSNHHTHVGLRDHKMQVTPPNVAMLRLVVIFRFFCNRCFSHFLLRPLKINTILKFKFSDYFPFKKFVARRWSRAAAPTSCRSPPSPSSIPAAGAFIKTFLFGFVKECSGSTAFLCNERGGCPCRGVFPAASGFRVSDHHQRGGGGEYVNHH